jgi:hypothetical protein
MVFASCPFCSTEREGSESMTHAGLSRMAFGYATSQILYAAVGLGVPDALSSGALPVEKLAHVLRADRDGLTRLLRALVVLGVLEWVEPGQVALTEPGRALCAGHPRSIHASVLLLGDPASWRAWGALTEGVRTGRAAFDHVHGRPLFDHLAEHPDLSGVFNAAMREGTARVAAAVPGAYDLSSARTVVDVGGGDGTLLAAVMAAATHARGVLLDTAAGAAAAAGTLRRAGVADRCTVEVGDFFRAVPAGDLMMLKGILHDWDDDRCVTILRGCRDSIADTGSLLVIEPVLPERCDTVEAAGVVMSDIAMLVYTGGRERSRAEYQRLLAAGGFRLAEVTAPLADSVSRILVARPAG